MENFYKRVDALEKFIVYENYLTKNVMFQYIEKIRSSTVTEQDIKNVEMMGNEMTQYSTNPDNPRDVHFYIEGGIMFVIMTALETSVNPNFEHLKMFKIECQLYGIHDYLLKDE